MIRIAFACIPALLAAAPVLAQPAAAEQPMPSVASLFLDLGHDIRQLPSRSKVIVLGVAGAASLAVHDEDADVTRRASGAPPLEPVFEGGEVAEAGEFLFGTALATYAWGRAAHNSHVAVLGADLFRAQVLSAIITQGLKVTVNRTRPDGSRYSFPSGHTSGTFAAAAVLQRHYGWRVGAPAYALATYVGGSRLEENKHYMSDVLFGAGVGIVSGGAVTVGRGAARFALVPLGAPDGSGAGLGLTLVGRPSTVPPYRQPKLDASAGSPVPSYTALPG
jgi:membrane-associated phospholipid phosphatase